MGNTIAQHSVLLSVPVNILWLTFKFHDDSWVGMSCLFSELDSIKPGAIRYANKLLTWLLDKVPLGIPLQQAQ